MNILIADDHTIVRKSIKAILHDHYRRADIPFNGSSLVEQVITRKWDVIIADISMPGITGAGVIKKIKQFAPDTPLLILSGHPVNQYAIPTIQMGASCYLNKESTPEELVKAIDSIISGESEKYFTNEVAELLADFVKATKNRRKTA